jgi:hypothetical protein
MTDNQKASDTEHRKAVARSFLIENCTECAVDYVMDTDDPRVALLFTTTQSYIVLAQKVGVFKMGTIISTQSPDGIKVQIDSEWRRTLNWKTSTSRY